MKKYHHSIYILILVGLLTTSCNGQVRAPKPPPEVIGFPPLVSSSGPFVDPDLVSQYIRSIFQDSKGNYWFGPGGHGPIRYDGKTLRYFSEREVFGVNDSIWQRNGTSVHAITEDNEGNIWFGTNYGPVRFDGKNFRSYNEKDGLSNIDVGRKSILVDRSGTVWIGTGGGAFRYNASADGTGGKCFSLFELLPPISVKGIMEDKAGNIWFASGDKGVFRYDGKTITNFAEKEGLGGNYAGGMIQDKTGNYWFVMKAGVCRYDGKTFTEFTSKDGLGGTEFWGICGETSGIIWITARGATTRYDPSVPASNPKAFTVFTPEDGLNCCVQTMYEDRSGNMWWGAGSGLYRFDGKKFYQVKKEGPW